MKIFTKRSITQKLIISIVCVILLNFCITPNVQAKSSFGGKMMGLMRSFATGIADVAAALIQFGVTGEWIWVVDKKGSGMPNGSDYWTSTKNFNYPILQISPELIFANEIQLLDANFISPVKDAGDYAIGLKDASPLLKLRNVISGWYVTLRTIAVVGLLSVLIYVGIRIIIASTSGDKAKYKQRLLDWVVAFCLLFFMHYIMAAVVTVVERVDHVLADTANVHRGLPINSDFGTVQYPNDSFDINDTVGTEEKLSNIEAFIKNKISHDTTVTRSEPQDTVSGGTDYKMWEYKDSDGRILVRVYYNEDNHKAYIADPCSELQKYEADLKALLRGATFSTETGSIGSSDTKNEDDKKDERTQVELDDGRKVYVSSNALSGDGSRVLYFTNYARLFLNVKSADEHIQTSVAYLIIYIALISFTVMFAFRYIKRVIYIAFLTLMAPLVALTYPLDKIKDRKSTSVEYVV